MRKGERKEVLSKILKSMDSDSMQLAEPLIDQLIFLEEKLDSLKRLPFIVVKKGEPQKQKSTPAYRQYKDLSQTYINALKTVNSMLGIESDHVESPLREYMKLRVKELENDLDE